MEEEWRKSGLQLTLASLSLLVDTGGIEGDRKGPGMARKGRGRKMIGMVKGGERVLKSGGNNRNVLQGVVEAEVRVSGSG